MIKIIVFLTFIIFFTGAGIASGLVVGGLQTAPDFEPDQIDAGIPSKIKDGEGEEIIRLDREHYREEVAIEDVPEHVIEAFIAIEDARFYDHMGIDVRGISRAAINNYRETGNPFQGSQGGSTITQQLVKNIFLSPKQLLERKIHEAWLALHVERTYTKDEILEFYFNYATYFHHNAYGIQAASRIYFDKDVEDLTVKEAAMLAGIIRNPRQLSPYVNPEAAKNRMHTVLTAMKNQEFITEDQYEEALATELDDMLASIPETKYPYPHFMDYVINEEAIPLLEKELDIDDETFSSNDGEHILYHYGLTIHTTIDRDLQERGEQIMDDPDNYPATWEDEAGVTQPQGSLVVSDPNTGEVKALIGGRDYGHHNMVNRVVSKRSPGSALKPINVYAPAMEKGIIDTGTTIDDAPSVWETSSGSYTPENFDNNFRGFVTVRQALADSLNIPAVKVYHDKLERTPGIELAEAFGINTFTEDDPHNAAAAIGGLEEGVKPIELTEAYATLANQGVRTDHHTITKIEDRHGNILYEAEPESDIVISEETAWLITDILKEVIETGTARVMDLDFPAAAKTGTSQRLRDAWLVGYTPNLVTTVWLGHDRGDHRIEDRVHYVTSIIGDMMGYAHQDLNPTDFEQPDNIEGPVAISTKSGKRASDLTPSDYTTYEYFTNQTVPTEECDAFVEKEICTLSLEEQRNEDSEEEPQPMLATEDCPSKAVETDVFLDREEPKETDNRWDGWQNRTTWDADLMPPEEPCDFCTDLEDDELDDEETDIDLEELEEDELEDFDEDELEDESEEEELEESDEDELEEDSPEGSEDTGDEDEPEGSEEDGADKEDENNAEPNGESDADSEPDEEESEEDS